MMERAHMHHSSMPEIWEVLTEEQKKKVALMKIDMKVQWMEMKISEMEKMIEIKKKAIDNIKMVREMLKE